MANKNSEPFTGDNLARTLWETLQGIKNGSIEAKEANSIAAQSREIVRVVRTQIHLSQISGRRPSKKLSEFSGQEVKT